MVYSWEVQPSSSRIFPYVRVSHPKQAAEDKESLAAQRGVISLYCENNGLYRPEGADFFQDIQSAEDMNRPGIQALKKAIIQNEGGTVVVQRLDRLTRNPEDFRDFLQFLKSHNAILVSVREGVDFGTTEGQALGEFMVTLGEYYLHMTGDATKTSLKKRREEGLAHSGIPPYGFSHQEVTVEHDGRPETKKKLVPVESELKVVAYIFLLNDLYNQTPSQIAKGLTTMRMPPRQAAKWSKNTIKNILKNRDLTEPFIRKLNIQPDLPISFD